MFLAQNSDLSQWHCLSNIRHSVTDNYILFQSDNFSAPVEIYHLPNKSDLASTFQISAFYASYANEAL